MDKREMIKKYNEGKLTGEEVLQLEKLIEQGVINPEELQEWELWAARLEHLKEFEPSERLDNSFYNWLPDATEKLENRDNNRYITYFTWWHGVAAAILLICGVGIGFMLDKGTTNEEQLTQLSKEMKQMQEIMMFTLLKEGSTSDRLKAVGYTSEIAELSDKIINELLFTLNNDENINVRIATVEALARYTENAKVREGLVKSINQQKSPLVQMALVELMVGIREKASVEELQRLLERNNITPEVKSKLEESINILI